jgi:hypothetical protein
MGNFILSEDKVEKAFQGTNFGSVSHEDLITQCLLKRNCGYYDGFTIICICKELGLLTKTEKLTKLGKEVMFKYFWKVEV